MKMLTQNKTLALLLTTFTVAALAQGCGSDAVKPKDAGTVGTAGNGGSSGTAGASGQGGAGTSGQGGAGASGQSGAGASGQDGGGTAGTAAAGSDGGVDAPIDVPALPTTASWLFDTTVEGWHFTKYGSTPDANAANNLANISTLAWDGTNDADNKTTSGSLKGTVPFTAFGDRIDFQAFTFATGMYNWSASKISAKVKLVSGGNINAGCPLTAWLYVSQAPDYNTTYPAAVNLSKGDWVTLTYDVSTAALNTAAISQMGIQITTGASCSAAAPDAGSDAAADAGPSDGGVADAGTDGGADAGADAGAPATATTAVILVDDVIVSLK
jgi:hypothetical protein